MVSVDESPLDLLRNCMVKQRDGSTATLQGVRPGSTLAHVNPQSVELALCTLEAWTKDHSVELPDVVIWPDAQTMATANLTHELVTISVAALDHRLDQLLASNEPLSIWRVTDRRLVPITAPRRQVDHVIDLGDVLR